MSESRKPTVFISHSTRDSEVASAFGTLLTKASRQTIDIFQSTKRGIEYSRKWFSALMESLRSSACVVSLLTPEALRSQWVLCELGVAIANEIPVFGLTVGMLARDLPSGPFQEYQLCEGTEESNVHALCEQILRSLPNAEVDDEQLWQLVRNYMATTANEQRIDPVDSHVSDIFEMVIDRTSEGKPIKGKQERRLVRCLHTEPDRMTPETFYRGIEFLYEQTKRQNPPLAPDLVIGVNATAGMIASYIDGRHDKRRNPVSILKTGPKNKATGERSYYEMWLPPQEKLEEIEPTPQVLVVDSQSKSGDSSREVFSRLNGMLPENSDLSYAALIACELEWKDSDFEQPNGSPYKRIKRSKLFRKPKRRGARLPDFVAYVSKGNVKPPEGMP